MTLHMSGWGAFSVPLRGALMSWASLLAAGVSCDNARSASSSPKLPHRCGSFAAFPILRGDGGADDAEQLHRWPNNSRKRSKTVLLEADESCPLPSLLQRVWRRLARSVTSGIKAIRVGRAVMVFSPSAASLPLHRERLVQAVRQAFGRTRQGLLLPCLTAVLPAPPLRPGA